MQEETDSEYLSYDKSDEESLQVQREFDELANAIFCDAAQSSSLYLHFLLKDPEAYGIRSTASPFGEYSLVKLQEESDHLQMLFDTLNQISYNRLTSDQQFLYALLRDYLEVSLPAKGLELYSQPLSETIGVQAQLPILLSEYRIASKEEAEEYLSLLEAVPSLFQEIMAFERQKTEAGLGLDDGSIDRIIASCEASMTAPASHPLTETFEERISQLSDLSAEEKEKYLEQNTKVITEVFIPAYQSLIDELTALKGKGGNSGGLCAFPDGKEYYEYLVKSETGTSYSMEELYKQLQVRLDSDLRTISKMVTANPDLREQMNSYLYSVSEPTDILSNLQAEMTEDFPALADSSSTLTLKYVPKALESSLSPAFFLLPPIDDLQNNTIYINRQSVNQTTSLYSTLAHEGMPGHLYQTLYYMQKNRSPLTRILSCSGYIEGWATYSEYYSYSFDNGLHSDLQQLLAHNSAAILGLSALLDYNVNYKNWDKNDVADYLNNNYGIDDAAVAEDMFYSMVDCPANYLTYYTGYLEIMDLKETAEKELGDNFDIKEFHTFLLDMAPASFRVIRQYFNSWLLSQKA
ncbi:MAG: DUF885 domain-containing protein [bacterium]|nr:DUF885 domain-containing protein [bacterium]